MVIRKGCAADPDWAHTQTFLCQGRASQLLSYENFHQLWKLRKRESGSTRSSQLVSLLSSTLHVACSKNYFPLLHLARLPLPDDVSSGLDISCLLHIFANSFFARSNPWPLDAKRERYPLYYEAPVQANSFL